MPQDNGNMITHLTPESLDDAYTEWLNRALDYAKGKDLSQVKISELTGINRTSLSKARKGPRAEGGRALKAKEVAILSRVTGFPIPTQFAVANADVMTDFIQTKMPTAEGLWREVSKTVVPVPLEVGRFYHPAYEGLTQYGRLVEDDHADLFVPKGFYVICVDYHEAKSSLNDGDIVVVERLETVDGKSLIETTVRRLTNRKGQWTLDPMSSRTDSAKPIPYSGDTPILRIRDFVLSCYKPAYSV